MWGKPEVSWPGGNRINTLASCPSRYCIASCRQHSLLCDLSLLRQRSHGYRDSIVRHALTHRASNCTILDNSLASVFSSFTSPATIPSSFRSPGRNPGASSANETKQTKNRDEHLTGSFAAYTTRDVHSYDTEWVLPASAAHPCRSRRICSGRCAQLRRLRSWFGRACWRCRCIVGTFWMFLI